MVNDVPGHQTAHHAPGGDDTAGSVHQMIFRWDGNQGRQGTGMTAVAHSCTADRAEELGRELGPLLWVSGASATRPSVVRALSRDNHVMLVRRWPTVDRAGRPSTLSYALVGDPQYLKTRLCLGLAYGGWGNREKAEQATGAQDMVSCQALHENARARLPLMTKRLPEVRNALIAITAEWLRDPGQRISLRMDELPGPQGGDSAALVYLGLFMVFSSWLGREWTFATYDTVDTHPLRLTCVPHWEPDAGGAGPLARVVTELPRTLQFEHEVATRLVEYLLDNPNMTQPGVPLLTKHVQGGAALSWPQRQTALRRVLTTVDAAGPHRPPAARPAAPAGAPTTRAGGAPPTAEWSGPTTPARPGPAPSTTPAPARPTPPAPARPAAGGRPTPADAAPPRGAAPAAGHRGAAPPGGSAPRPVSLRRSTPASSPSPSNEPRPQRAAPPAAPTAPPPKAPAAGPGARQAGKHQAPHHQPAPGQPGQPHAARGTAQRPRQEAAQRTPQGAAPRPTGHQVSSPGAAPGERSPHQLQQALCAYQDELTAFRQRQDGWAASGKAPSPRESQAFQEKMTTTADRLADWLRGFDDAALLEELYASRQQPDARALLLEELGRPERVRARTPDMMDALCTEVLSESLYYAPHGLESRYLSPTAMMERATQIFAWAVAPVARHGIHRNALAEIFRQFCSAQHPLSGTWTQQVLTHPSSGSAPDLPPEVWQTVLQEVLRQRQPPSAPSPPPHTTQQSSGQGVRGWLDQQPRVAGPVVLVLSLLLLLAVLACILYVALT